jgi:hypothetical protein
LARAISLMTPTNAVAANLNSRFILATYAAKLRAVFGRDISPLHVTGAHLYSDHRLIPTIDDFLQTTLAELDTFPSQQSAWTMETIAYYKRTMERLKQTALYRILHVPPGDATGQRGELAPIYHLFTSPALVQLQALSDAWPEEGDTLFFLISGMLTSYWKSKGLSESLRHVLVLEEAHRLMPARPKSIGHDFSSSPAEEAARAAANMLAESRGYGQGVILVDQNPSAVLPEALSNTTTRFFFRPKDGANKELISHALGLSPDEADYLVTLPRGVALTELPDENRPFIMTAHPPITPAISRGSVSDGEALAAGV